MTEHHPIDNEIWNQLVLDTYMPLEERCCAREKKDILARNRDKLELSGSVVIAMLVASLTIFINFIAVNLILHF